MFDPSSRTVPTPSVRANALLKKCGIRGDPGWPAVALWVLVAKVAFPESFLLCRHLHVQSIERGGSQLYTPESSRRQAFVQRQPSSAERQQEDGGGATSTNSTDPVWAAPPRGRLVGTSRSSSCG
jgi:hypothetical protein